MTHPFETDLEWLVAKQKIADRMTRYVHGVDRKDRSAMGDTYWPEAHDDHGIYAGPASGFVDFCVDSPETLRVDHILSMPLTEFDGPRDAYVETHVVARHELPTAGGIVVKTLSGRYLDRFQCRNGDWRVLDRKLVVDWIKDELPSGDWSDDFWNALKNHQGGTVGSDPWYAGEPPKRADAVTEQENYDWRG